MHFSRAKRECAHCGRPYSPTKEGQRFCRPWCSNEYKKRIAKAARRIWVREGRPSLAELEERR
jgi:hypothetical protein